ENLQFTGAFKERGASNRLALLSNAERARGVLAVSAGNHALAVAHHARRLGIACTVVMPATTPWAKVAPVEWSGATVELAGGTFAEGIAVKRPGVLTRRIVDALVDDVVAVPEARIEEAISLYLEVEKTVAEGAGAAGLAAVLHDPARYRGRSVGLVLSGGNI